MWSSRGQSPNTYRRPLSSRRGSPSRYARDGDGLIRFEWDDDPVSAPPPDYEALARFRRVGDGKEGPDRAKRIAKFAATYGPLGVASANDFRERPLVEKVSDWRQWAGRWTRSFASACAIRRRAFIRLRPPEVTVPGSRRSSPVNDRCAGQTATGSSTVGRLPAMLRGACSAGSTSPVRIDFRMARDRGAPDVASTA